MTEATDTAKRNIIICCDGTGNEISENISNVLKLYRCLRKTEKTEPRQLVFYDPGAGTLARPSPWRKLQSVGWVERSETRHPFNGDIDGFRFRSTHPTARVSTFVIPGRAKHELRWAIAHRRIHNHDREYGFRARAKWRAPE